jgi:hypothetical protein
MNESLAVRRSLVSVLVGAMVHHLSEDAQLFEGKTVFYSDDHYGAAGVGAVPYWLKRPPR